MAASEAYTFGNHPPYEIERLRMRAGELVADQLVLVRPQIEESQYWQAVEDINRTWGVFQDPESNLEFEGAVANLQAPLENGVDVELSTFTSSISGNPGNAVEFAENAALHPERRRIYIASFGNGRSSYWSAAERKYIRRTGRFIQPDGAPLPTAGSLSRALQAAELVMTRCFSSNSAGGAYATALIAALPEGQVTHAYFKSRPNISNHPLAVVWGLGTVIGDAWDDRKYNKISDDPWKLTPGMVKLVKERLPNVYSKAAQNRYQSFGQKALTSHKLNKMWSDLTAFSRGGLRYNNPAALDTVRALRQQPEALLTYHFPLQDRLYKSREDIYEFIRFIYDIGNLAAKNVADGQIEALLLPGKHRDHTKYPGLRWAGEDYAFTRSPIS